MRTRVRVCAYTARNMFSLSAAPAFLRRALCFSRRGTDRCRESDVLLLLLLLLLCRTSWRSC